MVDKSKNYNNWLLTIRIGSMTSMWVAVTSCGPPPNNFFWVAIPTEVRTSWMILSVFSFKWMGSTTARSVAYATTGHSCVPSSCFSCAWGASTTLLIFVKIRHTRMRNGFVSLFLNGRPRAQYNDCLVRWNRTCEYYNSEKIKTISNVGILFIYYITKALLEFGKTYVPCKHRFPILSDTFRRMYSSAPRGSEGPWASRTHVSRRRGTGGLGMRPGSFVWRGWSFFSFGS